ncbi:DMT family transporter [Cohnella terricola]|uniref:EamA family transporter n=1 Tax=Cohnella terricola TaxID=1289167 RepID=A0A559JPY4_9BACL|nr:EamA family transporter [Cohnella terricola]TVY01944.1 EamA family transporter [Cohnella terricola]
MKLLRYAFLVLITTFLMGIAFPIGKLGLAYAPPFLLMGIRFVLAGGLLALAISRKQRSRPQGKKQWVQAAAIGVCQTAGVMGCAYFSMQWISSGESSILISINPLLVILFGAVMNGTRYRGRQWIGVAVGFIGVMVAFGFRLGMQAGTLIGFAGAVFFALATLLTKRWGGGFDKLTLAAYQMLAGGIVLLALSAITEHPSFQVNFESVTALLCLIILCSIVQFSLWYKLLSQGDPGKTSSYLFLMPIFGVLTSWALLGEQVNQAVYIGGAIVCIGIFLVNWETKSDKKGMASIPRAVKPIAK